MADIKHSPNLLLPNGYECSHHHHYHHHHHHHHHHYHHHHHHNQHCHPKFDHMSDSHKGDWLVVHPFRSLCPLLRGEKGVGRLVGSLLVDTQSNKLSSIALILTPSYKLQKKCIVRTCITMSEDIQSMQLNEKNMKANKGGKCVLCVPTRLI